jgi:hypothetical protein
MHGSDGGEIRPNGGTRNTSLAKQISQVAADRLDRGGQWATGSSAVDDEAGPFVAVDIGCGQSMLLCQEEI